MENSLRQKIEVFIRDNIGSFHEKRITRIRSLKLKELVKNKNPYLFRAKNLNAASDFVNALLEARLSSSEETSFGGFLESLAIEIAKETCGGLKSPADGIDIDLTKGPVRYLIAVKSGKSVYNADSLRKQLDHFDKAVRTIKQHNASVQLQPTIGICYGNFPTKNTGRYLKIGGQSFWHLLSDDPDLYADIVEPLGFDAEKHDENFKLEKDNAVNRMTREFTIDFCDEAGAIQWPRLVNFVSGNLET